MNDKTRKILLIGAVPVVLGAVFAVRGGLPFELPFKLPGGLFGASESAAPAGPMKRPKLPGQSADSKTASPSPASDVVNAEGAHASDQPVAGAAPADESYDESIDIRIARAQATSEQMLQDVMRAAAAADAEAARSKEAAELARQGKSAVVATAPSPHQGSWRGTYTGFDTGRLVVTVGQDGSVTGSGLSEKMGTPFALKGSVSSDGGVSLGKQVAGAAAEEIPFKGTFAARAAAGTWSGGTWKLDRTGD